MKQSRLTYWLSTLHLGEESLSPIIILQFQQQLWGFFSFDSYFNGSLSRKEKAHILRLCKLSGKQNKLI